MAYSILSKVIAIVLLLGALVFAGTRMAFNYWASSGPPTLNADTYRFRGHLWLLVVMTVVALVLWCISALLKTLPRKGG